MTKTSKNSEEPGIPKVATIGQRMRAARNDKELALYQLSERTGLAVAALVNIEMGRSTPGLKTVERIARALSVSVAWLDSGPQFDQRKQLFQESPSAFHSMDEAIAKARTASSIGRSGERGGEA